MILGRCPNADRHPRQRLPSAARRGPATLLRQSGRCPTPPLPQGVCCHCRSRLRPLPCPFLRSRAAIMVELWPEALRKRNSTVKGLLEFVQVATPHPKKPLLLLPRTWLPLTARVLDQDRGYDCYDCDMGLLMGKPPVGVLQPRNDRHHLLEHPSWLVHVATQAGDPPRTLNRRRLYGTIGWERTRIFRRR